MGMSWKSLELLRNNLGEIGGGVTSYLHNVQAENDRQADLDALKQFAQTPEGQKISPGLMSLAGSRAGQRVLPQLQGVMGMQRETAPQTGFVQPGEQEYQKDPLSGQVTMGAVAPGTRALSPEQQLTNQYLDLQHTRTVNPKATFTPEEQTILNRGDQNYQNELGLASARASITGGINDQFQQKRSASEHQFQQQRSSEEDARRQTEKVTSDYGKQMSDAQDRILAAQAKLKLFKQQDGTMKDADFSTGKPIHRADVESELGAANNDWNTARKQLNQTNAPFNKYTPGRGMPQEGQTVPKSTSQKANPGVPLSLNDGWQQHPSGYLVRDVTPQTS